MRCCLAGRLAPFIIGVSTVGLLFGSVRGVGAQAPRPPEAGGETTSLGQPKRSSWQVGFSAGAHLRGANHLMIRAHGGAYTTPLNPVAKLAEIGFETYFGARGDRADAGLRAIFQVPYFSTGVGADYSLSGRRLDVMLTVHTPVRRGGFLTRGTMLRFDWYPANGHSFTLGVTTPFGDPLAGRNRPRQDYVVVAERSYHPEGHRSTNPALRAELDSLARSARWIRRLLVPFLDHDGRRSSVALARTARYISVLASRVAQRSANEEVRYFHTQMEHAFYVATQSAEAARQLASQSRRTLLDEVLIPYDRLVGRKKRNDTLRALSVAARGRFSRWVVTSGVVPASQAEEVMFVFQRVTEIFEAERDAAAKEWDDPRLVWLPLQYGLLPEEHDEQSELDALVQRVADVPFTGHNRISYVANLQFHWELLRMIRETRHYHVLWIHDFPATSAGGGLDDASLSQVVDGYLTALAERVEGYDSTGSLPLFLIFLDQHYYEQRKSRLLLTVLEDPLRARADIESSSPAQANRVRRALERLRTAAQRSLVLQAEARQYGPAWVRNRIKVHVNITNRVDASFWSGGLVSSVFGYPDDVMRDHRKIAFRDVGEENPFAGMGILTGMGVGQQYIGPGWDDRSLVLRGPVLLQLKAAARELLVSQGVTPEKIPPPLRSPPLAKLVARLAAPPDATGFDSRAMAVVNETGYLTKSLNAARALLYSLMPPGSVIKVPDSLWNATFYAALLLGAAMRGNQVLIIAPAWSNAPSRGFPQMARAHELLTRLLLARRQLSGAMQQAGGALHVGLYALPADAHGFASRAERWARSMSAPSFLLELMPFAAGLVPVVGNRGASSRAGDYVAGPTLVPKLHQKVQFFATAELWREIGKSPEWPRFMSMYLRYREVTYAPTPTEDARALLLSDSLEQIAVALLAPTLRDGRAASFAVVGSQNQDYRGIFMDGEVGVIFTGATSLLPLVDLVFMTGTVTWIEDQATLDRLLPPVGELRRRIGRVAKDGV